jgi:hypothetical protein
VGPMELDTAGAVNLLIVQACMESVCFEQCGCIFLFIFDHDDIGPLLFE